MQRFFRRFPPIRYAAYRYALQLRQQQRDSQWRYAQTVLMGVGNMTITWAGVERMLDELIAWHQHGFTDLSREHPRSLSSKLDYLRLMQREERFSPQFREFLRTTRIETKKLGNERHEIIHGLLHHQGGPGSLKWRTQRVIYEGPNARIRQREFHNDELLKIGEAISEFSHTLSRRVWVITQFNNSYPFTGDVEQTLRELGLTQTPVEVP